MELVERGGIGAGCGSGFGRLGYRGDQVEVCAE